MLNSKRKLLKEVPKYPAWLPLQVVLVLLEYFSRTDGLGFDPMVGASRVDLTAAMKERSAAMGDLNQKGPCIFQRPWPR